MHITEQQPCAPGEIWYPGKHLDEEYPTPTNEELAALWQDFDKEAKVLPTQATTGVYGVLSAPQREIKAVASVDVCEVLRDTTIAIDLALGAKPNRRTNYVSNMWFGKEFPDGEYARSVIVSMARVLMNADHVGPHEHTLIAAGFMHAWRQQGIYIVANTSTLPGCEPGTIRAFANYGLRGCIDGLILPRNHDGKGPVTKAVAARLALGSVGIDLSTIPLLHIDDAPHHAAGFEADHPEHSDLAVFVPRTADNMQLAKVPDHQQAHSTAHAFELADAFFRARGVIA